MNVCTTTANAHSDLQNTRNPVSAFQSGRPSRFLKWGCCYEEGLDWLASEAMTPAALREQQQGEFSTSPHHRGWPLSGTLPGKRPLAILSSDVPTRSSAKLPPHLCTGQQTTISWKWLWPTNNLWGTWTGSLQTLSPQSHYSRWGCAKYLFRQHL